MQIPVGNEENIRHKVKVGDLRVGMHVSELDRPWLGMPFMIQGFCIDNEDEIEMLQKCCNYVYVTGHGNPVDACIEHAQHGAEYDPVARALERSDRDGCGSRYQDTATFEQELETAGRIFAECHELVAELYVAAESTGSVDLPRMRIVTGAVVDSVLRNPDALLLLQSLKSTRPYRYRHAVNCCTLAAMFSRFLGFEREEIRDIAMGALMLDVGAVRLPGDMLELTTPLSPLQQKLTRHHVAFGLDLLQRSRDIPEVVRDMIRTHHERVDGKGYPAGLRGEQIPVCGRIAAIVDSYDAMVNERPYRSRIAPARALCELHQWRDEDFHPELVEKFIQCIGVWPTGSLVELNSGQIGIILSQNRAHRLYPKVLVVTSAGGECKEEPCTVDLWEYCEKSRGKVLEIRRVIPPGEVGIEPADYFF